MIKLYTLLIFLVFVLSFESAAQETAGFSSIARITRVPVTKSTGEKPQSKLWSNGCKQWAVFPDESGTHIWRLDNTSWTKTLTISSNNKTKADCKKIDNVTHILLFEEITPVDVRESGIVDTTASKNYRALLVSVEFVPQTGNYKLWSKRPSTEEIILDNGVETATIDVDGTGRMWLASDGVNRVNVRWSDGPYTTWSRPITLAKGIKDDDICAVIALPGKIGVFWSNQNTKRFGFRIHTDGTDPEKWSVDEVPAYKGAENVGKGMADDHMNFAVASDGTLYCAVKTGYDTPGYPLIGLIVRRPSGNWDNTLYGVAELGTRPIVILNEEKKNVKVIYSAVENGGDILYKESSTASISFGSQQTLLTGKFDDPSSSKENYNTDVVVLFSSNTHAIGVLANTTSNPVACEMEAPILRIFTAYPNPFSEKTTIYFMLPDGGDYKLTLYDSKGAKVADLKKGTSSAGEMNAVEVPEHGIARGLYLIKLQAGQNLKSLKLVHER